jgi:hypothetical protein
MWWTLVFLWRIIDRLAFVAMTVLYLNCAYGLYHSKILHTTGHDSTVLRTYYQWRIFGHPTKSGLFSVVYRYIIVEINS